LTNKKINDKANYALLIPINPFVCYYMITSRFRGYLLQYTIMYFMLFIFQLLLTMCIVKCIIK